MEKDKRYVLEKLELTDEEFKKIMNLPIRSHHDYATDVKYVKLINLASRMLGRK